MPLPKVVADQEGLENSVQRSWVGTLQRGRNSPTRPRSLAVLGQLRWRLCKCRWYTFRGCPTGRFETAAARREQRAGSGGAGTNPTFVVVVGEESFADLARFVPPSLALDGYEPVGAAPNHRPNEGEARDCKACPSICMHPFPDGES